MIKIISTWWKELDFTIRFYTILLTVSVLLAITSFYFLPRECGFGANIRVEFIGFCFDILFIGFIFSIFMRRYQKKQNIKHWKEEIEDYRPWQEKEATYRIIGNVKRLQKAGVNNIDIDLNGCFFSGSYMGNLDFSNMNLKGAKLEGVEVLNLEGANLESAWLERAILTGANLKRTNLNSAILMGANLVSLKVDSETNLDKTTLTGAKIDSPTWFKLKTIGVIGADWIMKNYEIKPGDNWFVIHPKSNLRQN